MDEVLPVYGKEEKAMTVRVYFDNGRRDIPVGSQVKATIFAGAVAGNWLPASAVVSLGSDRVVFIRVAGHFRARKVVTGMASNNRIQVLSGLEPADSVAVNAQYLVDSEDLIKVNK
ncbi:hypothetical protein ACQ86N_29920 [Puia sp. P3]|uniref:hypothetical protein n=1 Tax=Puia sp. P3 TaxID=3423952 RepID=UPI003D6650DB